MKTNSRQIRIHAAMLAALLFTQAAYAFYNAATGRWLSRDPIEEVAGRHLYSFANNRPTMAVDFDGRMSLREVPAELPQPPTSGPYARYDGLTWFNAFEPDAKVYMSPSAQCCWKIFLPGHADLYYWWVRNAPGHEPGTTAKSHEMLHVAIHRDTYESFNASASDYIGQFFSQAAAECWRSVINSPLKTAWLAHNHTANLQLDAWYRGSEIPPAIQAEDAAWDMLAKEEEKCASME